MSEPTTYLITKPEVRLAFPSLFTPRASSKSKPDLKTYQAVLLMPPEFDKAPLYNAMKVALAEKFGPTFKLPPSKNPIHDAAEKDYDGFEPGWFYINVSNKNPVPIVDRNNIPVTDQKLIYPGLWVRAYINAYTWEHAEGGRGVSFGLNAIQIVRDGERFGGGGVPAGDVFEALGSLDTDEGDDLSADIFG